VQLHIERRKNLDGKKCVAPFINGFNVWDLPEKEWTPAVQRAIKNAYMLGVSHMRGQVQRVVQEAESKLTDGDRIWREKK